MTDPDLDTLLAAARDDRVRPSDALMARIMADAVAEQPRPVLGPQAASAPQAPVRWLQRLAEVFGGGGALAGASLAFVAGVFVGFSQPAPFAGLTSALLLETQFDTVELFPADLALWEEQLND